MRKSERAGLSVMGFYRLLECSSVTRTFALK